MLKSSLKSKGENISSGFSISFIFSDSEDFYSIAEASSSNFVTVNTFPDLIDTPEVKSDTDSLATLEDDCFDFIYFIFLKAFNRSII